MAVIRGDVDAVGILRDVWVVSNLDDEKFGEQVPAELAADDRLLVHLDRCGVVLWDEQERWAEKVKGVAQLRKFVSLGCSKCATGH